jgi:RNA polymerase sigma factor (sigma-70 family)
MAQSAKLERTVPRVSARIEAQTGEHTSKRPGGVGPRDPSELPGRQLQLVEAASRGDQSAFEELYRASVGPLARYVGALLSYRDAVEDVVAQTYLLAWRDLPKLREPARFEAWLFRIARNQAITAGRRRVNTAPLEAVGEALDDDIGGAPGANLESAASREEVQRALRLLPDEQRDVLLLRFVSELPHRDVAERLGRTEQATRALQYRALLNLRRVLDRFL